jgi:hypothetical protein
MITSLRRIYITGLIFYKTKTPGLSRDHLITHLKKCVNLPQYGGPPPPPPGDDDDDDDDSSDYSPWIYGTHGYGDNYASTDVESMTGGKKIWVLKTATIWDGWTISDQLPKFQTIADRGHTLIIRIQPRWGWSIPAPGAESAQCLDAVEAAAR